jgi:hypothetical protein
MCYSKNDVKDKSSLLPHRLAAKKKHVFPEYGVVDPHSKEAANFQIGRTDHDQQVSLSDRGPPGAKTMLRIISGRKYPWRPMKGCTKANERRLKALEALDR